MMQTWEGSPLDIGRVLVAAAIFFIGAVVFIAVIICMLPISLPWLAYCWLTGRKGRGKRNV